MKRVLHIVVKCMGILLLGGGIAVLALTAAYCVPVNEENAAASLEMIASEQDRPLASAFNSGEGGGAVGFHPAVLDKVTDALMLNAAFQKGESPLRLALDVNGYPRYWHGYALILRPLLYFINYGDLRVLNSFLQIFLIVLLSIQIWSRMRHMRYVLILLTSYALLMPLALPFSLQYSWCFYIAFCGILFAVCKGGLLSANGNYIYFFLALGMCTSFLDLLTFPLITWGFPLVWWIVIRQEEMSAGERLRKVVVSGIGWIAGYASFWMLKWIIATPILGVDVMADGFGEAFYRVGSGDVFLKSLMQVYERWEVLYCNWRPYEYGIYLIIITAWMLWAAFWGVRGSWRVCLKSGAYLLIAGSSIVWYLVLYNHTTLHHFFTYRIYGVGILAFLCFLAEAVPLKRERREKKRREKIGTAAWWFLFLCVSFALSTLAREDVFAIYGTDYRRLAVREGDVLETTFVPTFANLKRIGFCISAPEAGGVYLVSVLKEDEEIYRLSVPLSNHVEDYYHTEDVDWKLRAGEEYKMRLMLGETEGEVDVLVTEDGNLPLHEYRDLTLNRERAGGQLLGSFLYHAGVRSRLRLFYMALVWTVFLGALAALVREFFRQKNRFGKRRDEVKKA